LERRVPAAPDLTQRFIAVAGGLMGFPPPLGRAVIAAGLWISRYQQVL